jgi:hypothetical protein
VSEELRKKTDSNVVLEEVLYHLPAPPCFEHVIANLRVPDILAVAQIGGG